jgi:putative salt-induced outer membrane protein YdiY
MKKNLSYPGSCRAGLLAAAALCTGTGALLAQQNPAPAPAPKGWETTAAAGVSLTRGNTDTLLATLGLQTGRKWERDEVAAGVSGAYGEDQGNKTQEQINGFGQYNRLFTERFYGAFRFDAMSDEIADLDYRFKLSPMVGYYLIKNAKTTLAVEAGPALVFEHYSPKGLAPYGESYWAARFAERFEHKLTDTTKIWESVEYVPRVDEWAEKYLLTAEVGIDTAITKKLSLRVVFQDLYDSQPAPGRKNNDLRLIAGAAYKF